MKFWDSSAVVQLVVPQRDSALAETVFNADSHLVVWWATPVECVSAIARLERESRLSEEDAERCVARLDRILCHADEVDPAASIRACARRLVRVHPLRAADALQLAAAIELFADTGAKTEAGFVCFDARLAQAARKEGLKVAS